MEPDIRGEVAPLYFQPVRWASILAVISYYRIAYRVRGWGRLPFAPGPKLIVANHQHEMEAAVLVSDVSLTSLSWRYPIFTVSSRRMWEPGFMAERLPWLSPVLRGLNFGKLFGALGLRPIENELNSRPFSSIAFVLTERHGDLRIDQVFDESARERLPSSIATLRDILAPKNFKVARSYVKLNEVTESYRKEILQLTREQIDSDLAHFEALACSGAAIFLTPEGFYSGDGKMQRFRGAFSRLAPLARIWLAGISYDPFVGRRLSMLYRVAEAKSGAALEIQLKRVRPVTVSALLGAWLHPRSQRSFTETEARRAIEIAIDELPPVLFIDPELRANPATMVARALAGMLRLDIARKEGEAYRLLPQRVHPQFPRTHDMVEYLYNFHQETVEGGREIL